MRELRIGALAVGVLTYAALSAATMQDGAGKAKVEEKPKLRDGVIYVKLPPGELRMENIESHGRPLVRLNVGKTAVEAQTLFLGDSKGATRFESTKQGINWVPASGGRGFTFGNGGPSIREPGSTIGDPDYYVLEKLKVGNVLVTTPSIRFLFGAAKPRPTGREGSADAKPKAQGGPDLIHGVIHVAMPPGELRLEDVRDGRSLLRITVGKTVVEARTVFLGDGKGSTRFDAMKAEDAIKSGNVTVFSPGSSENNEDHVPLGKLEAGSLYVTTPSIIFRWGNEAKQFRLKRMKE